MDKVQPYKDEIGEWRWKRWAPNNEEVAASSEGYKNFQDCMDNAVRINGATEDVEYLPAHPDQEDK